MQTETPKINTGASFPIVGILGLIFITLKLLGKIDWSWWWVLAPFWIPAAVVAVILTICGIATAMLKSRPNRR